MPSVNLGIALKICTVGQQYSHATIVNVKAIAGFAKWILLFRMLIHLWESRCAVEINSHFYGVTSFNHYQSFFQNVIGTFL